MTDHLRERSIGVQAPPQAPPEARTQAEAGAGQARIHYLDNLRALAMLLGVVLHGAFAYANPAQSIWLATDRRSSILLDAAIWWIHLFRMGLFFFISGYFAKFLLERRGVASFLRGRLLRLVVPFVVFYPFLWYAFGLLIVFALAYLPEPQGLMGLIRRASRQELAPADSPSAGTMHLWFLYYLALFSLLAAAAGTRRAFPPRTAAAPRSRCWWWCWWGAPLLLVPGVYMAGVPLPSPESFVPQVWPFAFYGIYYAAGWQFRGREEVLDRWQPHRHWLLASSALLFIPYYASLPVLDLQLLETGAAQPGPWTYLFSCLLTAYLSAAWTMLALLYGRHYLQRLSTRLKFLADASYWVYLVHLPVVLFLQTLLVPVDCSVFLKLALVLLGTALFSLATYVVFVRYTPLGWLLHGKRSFP